MKNQKLKWTTKWIVIPVISIAVLFMISTLIKQYNRSQDIEQNKFVTIAKVIRYEYIGRGGSRTHYIYHYDQKKYTSWQTIGSESENYVNHFFKVYISKKRPDDSSIKLNEEVTDSTEIENAGFKYK